MLFFWFKLVATALPGPECKFRNFKEKRKSFG